MLCIAGDCVAPSANGVACASGDECASKNCIDGVCCNNACDGQCQACNLAGSAGTCSAVKGDPVGGRAACNGGGTACAGTCDGVGAACTYPSFGTDCGTTCTDGQFIDKKCDNKGACVTKTPESCNNYACDTTGCKHTCVDVSDCASNTFACVANKCVPQATASCTDDGLGIQQGDKVVSCAPFRCKGGACVESCANTELDCDPNSNCGGDGKCIAKATIDDPSCGCSTKPAPFSTSAAIALLAIATSLARRARRGRREA
jgi:MYXO-CTERM domain-containing protein